MPEPIDPSMLVPLTIVLIGFFTNPLILICLAINLLLLSRMLVNPPAWRRMALRLQSRPWSTAEAGLIILVVIGLRLYAQLIVLILRVCGLTLEDWVIPITLLSFTFLLHVPVLLLIWRMVKNLNSSWSVTFGTRWREVYRNLRQGVVFYLAAMPFVCLTSLLSSHLLIWLGFKPAQQDFVDLLCQPQAAWVKLYLIALAVIAAPLTEELLFRGIALPALAKKVRLSLSIIIISCFFAAIHVNLFSFTPLFVLAVAFCLAYLYSGSILVPIVMHALFNGINLAVKFLL